MEKLKRTFDVSCRAASLPIIGYAGCWSREGLSLDLKSLRLRDGGLLYLDTCSGGLIQLGFGRGVYVCVYMLHVIGPYLQ